jgi:hypothetical protein
MAEVILSTEDLTVLGGPSSISVDVDFGPAGVRGSQIFVGDGDPNSPETEIGQSDIKILDLYINIGTSSDEYRYVYQYVSENAINYWKKLFKLIPDIKSLNSSATFVDGETTVDVLISEIVSSELVSSIEASSFNVQATIQGTSPVALSVSLGTPSGTGSARTLPVTINASEFVSGSWSLLSGLKVVQLLITVV